MPSSGRKSLADSAAKLVANNEKKSTNDDKTDRHTALAVAIQSQIEMNEKVK